MKWLFLLGTSAIATVIVVALTSVAAGKHALIGLELVRQRPETSILFAVLLFVWWEFVNDIAAAKGLSSILGLRVEFTETKLWPPISLRTRLYFTYPATATFFISLLASDILRL